MNDTKRAGLVASCIAGMTVAALAACNGGSRPTVSVLPDTGAKSPSVLRAAPFAVVNAGNNSVTLYRPGSRSVAATIVDRVNAPKAVAFDKKGDLYVANARSVTVYPPGSTRALRTITKGIDSPAALAFDRFDNLYIANQGNNTISVFTTEGKMLSRTISRGIVVPNALAFDGAGNLYVSNRGNFAGTNSSIAVYPPGKTTARYLITQAVRLPLAVVLDDQRNVYVANAGTNTVTVYAKGGSKLKRTVSRGVLVPSALAFDRSGNLYVASLVLNRITIYAPGGSKARGSITAGLDYPNAMAFDGSGTLYVSNLRGNAVTAYAPASHKYLHSVTAGMSQPSAVAFASSDVPLPSPSPTAQPSLLPQMLFVSNTTTNEIDAYTIPLGNNPAPALRITSGLKSPDHLLFDSLGDLFVANLGTGSILEFTPPYTGAPTTIQGGITEPRGVMALDGNGDLFVSTCANAPQPAVEEFVPPYTGTLVTLGTSNGISGACTGIATDAQGDLFVNDATEGAGSSYSGSGAVFEYAPPISNSSLPATKIASIAGFIPGETLMFDGAQDLFVDGGIMNYRNPPFAVNVYAPPYTKPPFATVSTDETPIGVMTLDRAGNLFAETGSAVVEYASPYSGTPVATLNGGKAFVVPASIAVSAGGYLEILYREQHVSSSANNFLAEFAPPFSGYETTPSGNVTNVSVNDPWVQGIALSPSQ